MNFITKSMGYLEIKLYSVCTFKYGELLAEHIKENWNRFLDDCYTVLRSSQISPEELLLKLLINELLLNVYYTFKNVQITFKLKHHFTCNNFNLICCHL